jgi:hypothetical protein
MKNLNLMLLVVGLMLCACNGSNKNKASNRVTNPSRRELRTVLVKNDTYCNARYGFCVDYPSNLKRQPESDNGDGCIINDESGIEVMRAWASVDANEEGIKKYYMSLLNTPSTEGSKLTINESLLENDFFELIGAEGDQYYFRKTVFKDGIFVSASCQTDKIDSAGFGKLVSLVRGSLKKTEVTYQ